MIKKYLQKNNVSSVTDSVMLELSSDLLQQSTKRLGIASLVLAFVWTFMIFITSSFVTKWFPFLENQNFNWINTAIGVVVIICSIALFFTIKLIPFSDNVIIHIALTYQVIVALSLAVSERQIVTQTIPGVSWLCVWILAFPIVFPCPLGKLGFTIFLSVSLEPLVMILYRYSGKNIEVSTIVDTSIDNYIIAIVSLILAHVIHNLGKEITKARKMGNYSLKKLIGKGGMGEVWSAQHTMLKRPAAVKLVRKDNFADLDPRQVRGLLHRFELEAQCTATLHSPHTIALYDFGHSEQGDFFYVMELLDGIDLDTLVKNSGAISYQRTIFLLQQICDSLLDAYLNGLIHRDIKPANIFLCKYGHKYDFIKVLDFGLVKSDTQLRHDDPQITQVGMITGTPNYMAPEMPQGLEIDHRYDIYALGCVAYWLLAGDFVFSVKNSLDAVIAHMNQKPVRISERTAQFIPEELDRLIMDCLEKKREKRPQDIGEFLNRLNNIKIINPWTQQDAKDWWQSFQNQQAIPTEETELITDFTF